MLFIKNQHEIYCNIKINIIFVRLTMKLVILSFNSRRLTKGIIINLTTRKEFLYSVLYIVGDGIMQCAKLKQVTIPKTIKE